MFAFSMQGQSDSLSSKQKKKRFGVELGVGKPPVRYYTEEWVRESPNRSSIIKPVNHFHLYFSYQINKKNDLAYCFYFGTFRSRYQLTNYSQWKANDSVFVNSKTHRNEEEVSFSVGFSISKRFKVNKFRNLYFSPEAGLFFNALGFDKSFSKTSSRSFRVSNNMVSWLEPLESYETQETRSGSLFNGPSNVNDVYSISPMLRMGLIKDYKDVSLSLNYNTFFMPYYSFTYIWIKSYPVYSNISFNIRF